MRVRPIRRQSSRHRARLGLAAGLAMIVIPSVGRSQPVTHYSAIAPPSELAAVQSALQRIVNQRARTVANTFCVMRGDRGDSDPLIYAIWKERRLLYRWEAAKDGRVSDLGLIGHQPLDLRRDIVRTQADALSTYKVTRAWIRQVEAACAADGSLVRLKSGARE